MRIRIVRIGSDEVPEIREVKRTKNRGTKIQIRTFRMFYILKPDLRILLYHGSERTSFVQNLLLQDF